MFANAGTSGMPGPLQDQAPEAYKFVIDVNVIGVMNTVKASLPLMKKTGGGTIALCSSVYGLRATPALVPYITSKHAVEGMKASLAAELIPFNIRVNNLNPSFTPSEMTGPFAAGYVTPPRPLSHLKMPPAC